MIPKPYYSNKSQIKAFVLGCDPTAFDKEERKKPVGERNPIELESVFDLNNGLKYFRGIHQNIHSLGFSLSHVYVQNLVTDYQHEETSKNKEWINKAQSYIAARKSEFDKLDPSGKLPVFLTSELLYKVLLNDGEQRKTAKKLYESGEVVIPAERNKLGRPLITLYRHREYSLKKYKSCLEKVKAYL